MLTGQKCFSENTWLLFTKVMALIEFSERLDKVRLCLLDPKQTLESAEIPSDGLVLVRVNREEEITEIEAS